MREIPNSAPDVAKTPGWLKVIGAEWSIEEMDMVYVLRVRRWHPGYWLFMLDAKRRLKQMQEEGEV